MAFEAQFVRCEVDGHLATFTVKLIHYPAAQRFLMCLYNTREAAAAFAEKRTPVFTGR